MKPKRTEKNAKIVPFFYKERKRMQRSFCSFIKNGKERIDCSVLLKRTDAQPWNRAAADSLRWASCYPIPMPGILQVGYYVTTGMEQQQIHYGGASATHAGHSSGR